MSSNTHKHTVVSTKPTAGLDLLAATIKDLQEALADGTTTAERLIAEYLDRIDANNKKGLELRGVMEVAPYGELMALARSSDEMRAKGHLMGKLHGIPMLIKDNISTDPKLGMHTTAGSFALLNSIPTEEATVVAKLRAAGAIIIGKTTMSELASYKASDLRQGWSALGGQGQSAYVAGGYFNGADASGSSSGSAIAVSAGWAPAALGTETAGSLITPSGRAALYTLRSSVGLVSRYGAIPASKEMDTIGPMTKSAYDAALLLECMSGHDPRDPATAVAEQHVSDDYTKFAQMPFATFEGKRLGIVRAGVFDLDLDWGDDEAKYATVAPALDTAVQKMGSLGAIICDPVDLPRFQEFKEQGCDDLWTAIKITLKEDLEEYLRSMKSTEVHCLRDIIEFNKKHPDLELPPGQGLQDLLIEAQESPSRDSETYKDAVATRICCDEGIDRVMNDFQLDALVFPINCDAANYAAVGSYPLAVVPLGAHDNGEPFGFCFLGKKWAEPTLIALMAAYEKNFPPRSVPALLI